MGWVRRQLQRTARGLVRASTIGFAKGDHVTRFWYYRHLVAFKAERNELEVVLAISGSERLAEIFGYSRRQIQSIEYPQYDLLSLDLNDNSLDAVFADIRRSGY